MVSTVPDLDNANEGKNFESMRPFVRALFYYGCSHREPLPKFSPEGRRSIPRAKTGECLPFPKCRRKLLIKEEK